MRKIFFFCFLILLPNCTGYSPIFTSNQINFYIEEIELVNDNKLVRKIIKNLKPYSIENGKQKVSLKLELKTQENVIMKDAKGDPASYEIKLTLNADIITVNGLKKLSFNENFSFNNQSNKFELKQYRNNIEISLINKIFESLIMELRSI